MRKQLDLLAVDIGNSRITCAHFERGQIINTWHHSTNEPLMAAQSLKDASDTTAVTICSVVPQATTAITNYLGSQPITVIDSAQQKLLKGTYATMGADRVANAYAAWKLHGQASPVSIIDLGTATTLTAVDVQAEFRGGFITLGLGSTLSALHQGTAQLPNLNAPASALMVPTLSTNTHDAMLQGTLWGHIGLLKQWLELADQQFGCPAKKILTGGWSSILTTCTDIFDIVDPQLILKGIYFMAEAATDPADRA